MVLTHSQYENMSKEKLIHELTDINWRFFNHINAKLTGLLKKRNEFTLNYDKVYSELQLCKSIDSHLLNRIIQLEHIAVTNFFKLGFTLCKTEQPLMSVNPRLKATKIIGQRKAFSLPECSCARKETVDVDILITSRNGDRKIMQFIRIKSRPSSRSNPCACWNTRWCFGGKHL